MSSAKEEDPLTILTAKEVHLETKLEAAETAGNQQDKHDIRQQLVANQQLQAAVWVAQTHKTPAPLRDFEVPYTWPYTKLQLYGGGCSGVGSGVVGAAVCGIGLLWGLPRTKAMAVGCATFLGKVMWGQSNKYTK